MMKHQYPEDLDKSGAKKKQENDPPHTLETIIVVCAEKYIPSSQHHLSCPKRIYAAAGRKATNQKGSENDNTLTFCKIKIPDVPGFSNNLFYLMCDGLIERENFPKESARYKIPAWRTFFILNGSVHDEHDSSLFPKLSHFIGGPANFTSKSCYVFGSRRKRIKVDERVQGSNVPYKLLYVAHFKAFYILLNEPREFFIFFQHSQAFCLLNPSRIIKLLMNVPPHLRMPRRVIGRNIPRLDKYFQRMFYNSSSLVPFP